MSTSAPAARPDRKSDTHTTGAYHAPPWTFTGKALYQLSLVRVSDARKYVPDSIPLVNIFGWTLGGFYLARYAGSPAGQFDELVALAGLAWNFPTSCAWAARVYVNSDEARNHGLKVVGLPSRLANFERWSHSKDKARPVHQGRTAGQQKDWWGPIPVNGKYSKGPKDSKDGSSSMIRIHNADGRKKVHVCSIDMSETVGPSTSRLPFMPKIQMFLPSFSGGTALCPDILKYSLRLETRVRFLKPLRVVMAEDGEGGRDGVGGRGTERTERTGGGIEAFVGRHVLGGRPLVCMSFEDMTMEVQAPEVYQKKNAPGKP